MIFCREIRKVCMAVVLDGKEQEKVGKVNGGILSKNNKKHQLLWLLPLLKKMT